MHAAKVLREGGLLAHQTGTVAGIAAHPQHPTAVKKLQRFKQRQGPFLLLADSIKTALSQARYITPSLRKMARGSWPGAVTLIFPAKPSYADVCYRYGRMAVRVDADDETRRLAYLCGGLLLSSSFNRRGKPTMRLSGQRCRRWVDMQLLPCKDSKHENIPSRIYHVTRAGIRRLR